VLAIPSQSKISKRATRGPSPWRADSYRLRELSPPRVDRPTVLCRLTSHRYPRVIDHLSSSARRRLPLGGMRARGKRDPRHDARARATAGRRCRPLLRQRRDGTKPSRTRSTVISASISAARRSSKRSESSSRGELRRSSSFVNSSQQGQPLVEGDLRRLVLKLEPRFRAGTSASRCAADPARARWNLVPCIGTPFL
jgi:hypothetical protein